MNGIYVVDVAVGDTITRYDPGIAGARMTRSSSIVARGPLSP